MVPRSGSDDDSPMRCSIYDFDRKNGSVPVEVNRRVPNRRTDGRATLVEAQTSRAYVGLQHEVRGRDVPRTHSVD